MKETKKQKKSNRSGWIFLLAVVSIYIIIYFINKNSIILAFNFLYDLIFKLVPVFLFVFVVMVIVDLFLTPKRIVKYIGSEAGIKKWFFVIIGGLPSLRGESRAVVLSYAPRRAREKARGAFRFLFWIFFKKSSDFVQKVPQFYDFCVFG